MYSLHLLTTASPSILKSEFFKWYNTYQSFLLLYRQRLGGTLRKIVGAGILYMILSCVESYLKLVQPKNNGSIDILIASLMLAIMDTGLCVGVFSSLSATIRALRLKRLFALLKELYMGLIIFLYELQEHGKNIFIQGIYWHAHFRRSGLFYLHVLVHLFSSNGHLSYRKYFLNYKARHKQ